MKRQYFIGLWVYLAMLCGVQLCYSQGNDSAVVNSFISKRAKTEQAEEYADARKIVRGDVNGDGKTDLVVLYSLEGFNGGNSYGQYLAIFVGSGRSFRYAANAAVAGKLNRTVELVSVVGGRINLDTTGYRPNDPACCPTKKGKTHYVFANGRLKETR